MSKLTVGIIMGSQSDLIIMKAAAQALEKFNVGYELTVVSAHRTPERMMDYAKTLEERGIGIVIAGAGGAAHLPGMIASIATVPVIGVPIKSSNSLDGWDSLLSIAQMPKGVPVATVAVDGAFNAGVLAVQMLAVSSLEIRKKLQAYKSELKDRVEQMVQEVQIRT